MVGAHGPSPKIGPKTIAQGTSPTFFRTFFRARLWWIFFGSEKCRVYDTSCLCVSIHTNFLQGPMLTITFSYLLQFSGYTHDLRCQVRSLGRIFVLQTYLRMSGIHHIRLLPLCVNEMHCGFVCTTHYIVFDVLRVCMMCVHTQHLPSLCRTTT